MPTQLLIATSNTHKIREIGDILAELGLPHIQLLGLDAFPAYQPPEEDGDSFAANSRLKAEAAARYSGLPALADDSGLAVDALGGAPGVFSARYAGEQHDDADNRAKLLRELAGLPEAQRGAAFVCVATLALPQQEQISIFQQEGRCQGSIAFAERGEQGFGYDSLFIVAEYGCHMAELSAQVKNSLSHRGRAIRALAATLKEVLA